MEAHWETGGARPLILFAIPDPAAETNHFEIAIPGLGSLILTHDWDGEVQGLKRLSPRGPATRSPVLRLPHHGGHRRDHARRRLSAVAAGWRGRLFDEPLFLRACSGSRRSASSRCSPAGSRPRSGASLGPSTASCVPRTRSPRSPAVTCSLSLVLLRDRLRHRVRRRALLPGPARTPRSRRTPPAPEETRPISPHRPLSAAGPCRARGR